MGLHRSVSFAFVVFSLAAVACGSSNGGGEGPAKITLAGRVGGGSTSTKSFGGVGVAADGLQITAHQVFKKGDHGSVVSASVANDGSWSIDVARGERWIVTIDSSDGHSAIVEIGHDDVIAVSADAKGGRVDIGDLHVIGGTATSSIVLDASLGLDATLAAADDAIALANGAVLDAQQAVSDAEKAAADAEAQAQQAAADAQQAAQDAEKNAGL
ncbi:MAG TPA: hypothetical protein VIF62_39970 [Labilithrix sp.]|jgi:hypothetical protein